MAGNVAICHVPPSEVQMYGYPTTIERFTCIPVWSVFPVGEAGAILDGAIFLASRAKTWVHAHHQEC
jgi:hypothetical protein